MFEFTFGIVLGSIFGVIADRLWQSIESRVRVDIHPYFHAGTGNRQTVQFLITNRGTHPLPEFEFVLYSHLWGSYHVFESDDQGDLLPGEERTFKCGMTADQVNPTYMSASPEERQTAALRLVLSKGRVVLYENHRIGAAIIGMFDAMARSKSFEGITGTISQAASARREPLFQWIKRRGWRTIYHPGTGLFR